MKKIFIITLFIFTCNPIFAFNTNIYLDSLKIKEDSTKKVKVVYDTLKVLQVTPLFNNSFYINKHEVDYLDYKYVGNVFNYVPFGFTEDLGYVGQIDEINIYGLGNNYISWLNDGLDFTNRIKNSANLYSYQFEKTDSIEILKLPNGFLAGAAFNPVSINFISKNVFSAKPYSKIRYYQADNEEGAIDFLFHTYLTKRLGLRFNLSNVSANNKYANSEYGEWLGSIYLKYYVNNFLSIIAGYSYYTLNTKLNGGVDYNYIIENFNLENKDFYIYDKFLAKVNYTTRYQKNYIKNFNVKVLSQIIKQMPAELTIYNTNDLTEFRQNEKQSLANEKYIFNNNKFIVTGLNFKQKISINKFTDNTLILNAERISYYADLLKEKIKKNNLALSGYHSLTIINNIVPSAFYKYAIINNKHYFGYGADFKTQFNNINFYFGFSDFTKPQSILKENYNLNDEKIRTLETSILYKKDKIKVALGYFIFNGTNHPYAVLDGRTNTAKSDEVINYTTKDLKYSGINLNFDYKIWVLLFSINYNYIFNAKDIQNKYSFFGGIYYTDTLFNSNLHLKAGINFKLISKQQGKVYDFERGEGALYYMDNNLNINRFFDPYNKNIVRADLFVAGKIQGLATVYFVFQNIFDEQNYYIPVYPLESRSIRFGFNWELFN